MHCLSALNFFVFFKLLVKLLSNLTDAKVVKSRLTLKFEVKETLSVAGTAGFFPKYYF